MLNIKIFLSHRYQRWRASVQSVEIYGTVMSKNEYFQYNVAKKYWIKSIKLSFNKMSFYHGPKIKIKKILFIIEADIVTSVFLFVISSKCN